MQNNFIAKLLTVHQDRDQHRIGILRSSLGEVHGDGTAFLQFSTAAGGGIGDVQDPGIGGILAGQLQLILHRSGGELIAVNFHLSLSVRQTAQNLWNAAPFQPGEGKLHIRCFRIVNDKVEIQGHSVVADLKSHVVLLTGLQHQRTALYRQLTGFSRRIRVASFDDLRLICRTAGQRGHIEEHMLRQIPASDRLGGGIIRDTRKAVAAAVLLLPTQLQLQVCAVGTMQNEGKIHIFSFSGSAPHPEGIISCAALRQFDGDAAGFCGSIPCTVSGFDLNSLH